MTAAEAFDNVLERLLAAERGKATAEAKSNGADAELYRAQEQVKRLERELTEYRQQAPKSDALAMAAYVMVQAIGAANVRIANGGDAQIFADEVLALSKALDATGYVPF